MSKSNRGQEQYLNGRRSLVLTSPSLVISDTIRGSYTFIDRTIKRLKKPSRFILPGDRIKEFSTFRGYGKEESFHYGKAGWENLSILTCNNKASFYYQKAQDVIARIESTIEYGKWLSENSNNKKLDHLNSLAYDLFREIFKRRDRIVRRAENINASKTSYSLISKVNEILMQTEIFLGSNRIVAKGFLLDEQYKVRTFKISRLKGIDVIVGYSLLWLGLHSRENSPKEFRVPLMFIGIVGILHLRHALEEKVIKFGIITKEVSDILARLEFSQKEVYKKMQENYLLPDLSNVDPIYETFKVEAELLIDLMNKVEFGRKVKFRKIHKDIEFDPFLPSDSTEKFKEVSTKFNQIRVSFRSQPRTFFEVLSHEILSRLKLNRTRFGPHNISKSISSQHSWTVETDELLRNYGFLSYSGDNFFISAYPKYLRLYPRQIESAIKPRKVVTIVVVFVFLIFSAIFSSAVKSYANTTVEAIQGWFKLGPKDENKK